MRKECCRCGNPKDEDDFHFKDRAKGTRQPYCKECKTAFNKAWYALHKDTHKKTVRQNNKKYQRELREIIDKAKDKPCADCGRRFPPVVMDFDHVDPATKLFNIAACRARSVSLAALLAEMSKCEVVCANCHRIRTHGISPHGPTDSAGIS